MSITPSASRFLFVLCALALFAGALAPLFAAEPPAASAQERESAEAAAEGPRFALYYLHGKYRCRTCNAIESGAKRAVERAFADELEAGTLRFASLNMETPENAHYVEDFQLVSSSLVAVELDGSAKPRYEVLPRVWQLSGKEERLERYVIDELRRFMDAAS